MSPPNKQWYVTKDYTLRHQCQCGLMGHKQGNSGELERNVWTA